VKKTLNKKEYYVYGLIDPRDNQYFYIGKGKGKRYLSHLKPKRFDFNYGKLERIKNIQNSGLDIKIEVLFPNLNEETAFELEKLIIYKLGREVLNEGILTNLNPEGRWKPKDSVFYPEDFKPEFDLNKLDFIAQQKFNEIPTLSQFNYLNTPNSEQNIYIYRKDGSFKREETLDEFFSDGIKGRGIELFKAIRENNLPIYSNWIYSKKYFEKIYISNKIPFSQYDIIDEKFNHNFDNEFDKSIKFNLECIINGILRMTVERNKNTMTLTSYYPSGNKKSLRKTKKGKPFKLASEWYENGNLSVKEELKDAYNEYIRTTYYENGKKEIKISTLKENRSYERWFQNGIKEVEFIDGIGYVHYDEQGNKTKIEGINNVSYYKKNQLTLDISENIEIPKEIKTEKEKSDLDWNKYQQEIDKLNEF
jgi:antitoxin component YwqK of YwqJK toxin-antitoxin module